MRAKLKPCPFCGGKAEIHCGLGDFVDVEIVCKQCSASGGCFNDNYTRDGKPSKKYNREEAIKHWNTRI